MGLDGIRTLVANTAVVNLGPGTPVGAQSTTSIAMSVANPGISNILSATLLIGMTGAPANTFGVSLNVYGGASPGLVGFFPVGAISEVNSSVLQFAGTGQAVGGTFGIQVNQSSGTTSGFLSSTDWLSFNSRLGVSTLLSTVFPIFGGTYLASGVTLTMPAADGSTGGYLTATDWNTFNNKQSAIQVGPVNATSFVNGATLFGATFQLGPADGTNPGVVTTSAQTFAGNKTFSGTILGAPGTTGAPEFSFSADPDTGMYNPQANNLQFVVGSTGAINLQSGLMTVYLDQVIVPNGSALVPSYSFTSAPNMGLYVFGASQLGVAVGATSPGYFDLDGYRTWRNKNIRFRDAGNNDLTVVAPTGFSNAMTWTLPLDQGATNTVLTNNGMGVLSWNPASFGLTTSLLLQGASSGVFTLSVGTSFASFTNTLPIAQGATGSFLQNNGTGGMTWTLASTTPNELITSGSGAFSTTSATYVDVTNLGATFTTTGGRIWASIVPLENTDSVSNIQVDRSNTLASGYIGLARGATIISSVNFRIYDSVTAAHMGLPAGSFNFTEKPAAGTYFYKIQAFTDNSATLLVNNCQLLIYEIH